MNQTTQQTMENEDDSAQEVAVMDRIVGGQIDRQIATARAYPRSLTVFKKKAMEMATLDEDTAESCFYALPRAGKTIQGPSARIAEIVASAWGHLRVEARVIGVEAEVVVALGTAWDMENNVAYSYEVRRRITDKSGKRYNEDMITVTANAACSIAARNATLKVVPPSYWKPIYEKCVEIVKGDLQTLADRRAAALDHFQKLGIPNDRVFALLEVKGMEDVMLDHLVTLKGLATALKEGDATLDEAFPKPESPSMPARKSEKKDDIKPSGERDLSSASSGVASGAGGQEADSAAHEGSKGSLQGDAKGNSDVKQTAKEEKKQATETGLKVKMDKLREFIKGPIETIRDISHEDFLKMLPGLKGQEFNDLLIEYSMRKADGK
jgi:hypothetical protein